MAITRTVGKKTRLTKKEALRFAHPFFTTTPINKRSTVPGVGTRMTDHIQTKLEPIPTPLRNPTMTLEEIIGKAGVVAIENAKSISFHSVGDTGHENGQMEELVADAMTEDYDVAHPEKSPAFFLHLGDVNYYDNTDSGYHAQFYVPYKTYPGKIVAIPGNHDGELFKWDGKSTGQTKTLEAFQKNFCQLKPSVPSAAGTIYREMVAQPSVYWMLDAPYIQIIGLYSNMAENPGYISGKDIGNKQKLWLTKTLTDIQKKRDAGTKKALLIAMHHPPISKGSHSSSIDMLADIDDSCTKAGLMPDIVLAAHAHSFQRFTRFTTFKGKKLQTPFYVVGSGGRGLGKVADAKGEREGDHTYDASLFGYGYLHLTVTEKLLTAQFYQVDTSKKSLYDSIEVNLETHIVTKK